MTKIPELYMVVSDEDCTDTSTLQQAKKETLEHFKNDNVLEVKIYKLVDIAERKIVFQA